MEYAWVAIPLASDPDGNEIQCPAGPDGLYTCTPEPQLSARPDFVVEIPSKADEILYRLLEKGSKGPKNGDPCDMSNADNWEMVNFIRTYSQEAALIEAATHISADFILAWAALESGNGTSRAAQGNNNFFGLRIDPPNAARTAGWAGAVPCSTVPGSTANYACFPYGNSLGLSILPSSSAALAARDGLYRETLLRIQASGGTFREMGDALHGLKYAEDPIYGTKIENRHGELKKRRNCT